METDQEPRQSAATRLRTWEMPAGAEGTACPSQRCRRPLWERQGGLAVKDRAGPAHRLLLLPLILTPGATLQAVRLSQTERQGRGKNPAVKLVGGTASHHPASRLVTAPGEGCGSDRHTQGQAGFLACRLEFPSATHPCFSPVKWGEITPMGKFFFFSMSED